MTHLEFNLQDGVILKENLPVGVYNKHKNVLVINIPNQLIVMKKSVKDKDVIDYVLDKGILIKSPELKVKYSSSLTVGYMTNTTYLMKHVTE